MLFDSNLWGQVKTNLKSRNQNNKLLDTWLAPVEYLSTDDTGPTSRLCLGVPSELHRYWISNNFLNQICSEITAIYTRPFQIELSVTGQSQQVAPDSPNAIEEAMMASTKTPSTPVTPGGFPQPNETTPNFIPPKFLREDHTFETFVVGRNNEFAHAASYNVARNPGAEGYNPLFICGPVGMGKTHLLHAVGNEIRKNSPHLRINYLTAETFLNECVSSIRRNEMEKFKARYREKSDVLLVDDIQFLKGESTQDEFFHTLNHFFAQKKQVVVASDRMPKDITGLEDRIRSRLEWGLIADIQMPDIETRLAILRYKSVRLK
ncbi:MAG: DnaA/Hda family protein, partial [Pseudobdellovibrionaceae bacterium]